MCTAITFKTKNYYFGRNLDLNYSLDNKVIITPRDYLFNLKQEGQFKNKYAIIGMAISIDNYPLYFDGMNEKGLCMAGLNFPKMAKFYEPKKGKINIAPFEFIPFVLGKYASLEELKKDLPSINLVDIQFNPKMANAPLHWIISDSTDKSIVVETTNEGMKFYDNEFGVLTNNPPFDYHFYNMMNYMSLNPNEPKNNINNKLNFQILSEGMGSFGLPGGYSSVSRFVKATYNKWVSYSPENEIENVTQFFHLLGSVEMVKGSVISIEKTYEYTQYTCCMSFDELTYYYKTYNNSQISAVKMKKEMLNSKDLLIFNLINEQKINYIN